MIIDFHNTLRQPTSGVIIIKKFKETFYRLSEITYCSGRSIADFHLMDQHLSPHFHISSYSGAKYSDYFEVMRRQTVKLAKPNSISHIIVNLGDTMKFRG